MFEFKTRRFFTFYNNLTDTNSLSANNITEIACDKNGFIWVETYRQGLNCIEKKKEKQNIL